MVTRPGTNWVWRSATTLIEANALPLTQTANLKLVLFSVVSVSGFVSVCLSWTICLSVSLFIHLLPLFPWAFSRFSFVSLLVPKSPNKGVPYLSSPVKNSPPLRNLLLYITRDMPACKVGFRPERGTCLKLMASIKAPHFFNSEIFLFTYSLD